MAIEGVQLSISSGELKDLLMTRVDYHAGRATFFSKKAEELAPELEAADDEAEEIGKYMSGGRGNDPAAQLAQKAKHHRNRATVLKFMAEHLVPNETYILTESDLQRIEVIGPGW